VFAGREADQITQHSGRRDAGRVTGSRQVLTPEPAAATTTLLRIRDMYNASRVEKPLAQYDLARFSIVVYVQSPAREIVYELVDSSFN